MDIEQIGLIITLAITVPILFLAINAGVLFDDEKEDVDEDSR